MGAYFDKTGQDPTWPATGDFVTSAKYKNDATIIIGPNADAKVKIHELGHADVYARHPTEYTKDQSNQEMKKKHDARSGEQKADEYKNRQRYNTNGTTTFHSRYERFDDFLEFATFWRDQ
jgi:hypothetical protein